MSGGALRVALLCPPDDAAACDLRDRLESRGHRVAMVAPRGLRVIDARAQRSGLEAGLTRMPFAAATLRRGTFDLVHACSLADAAVGARWSARTGRPAVWSVREAPDRRTLAARRRTFDLVRSAVGGVRSVVAPDRSVADACRRWLGVDAEVIDPRDAAAQEALYRRLVR